MKKILFAAVAVMAMAACSNEDVISRPALPVIGFDNAFVENSTRAADINAENLANFGVYGSVVNSSNQQGMIFANQEVTKTASGYTYTPAQYWIADAKYDFVAFAPYQSGDNATWKYATNGKAAENGTITFDNAKAGANQDFLFAATSCETPETFNKKPDAVGFTFNHMLSRVRFTFANGFGKGSNITLQVYDVTITDAYATGDLVVANGTPATEWSNFGGTLSKNFGQVGGATLATLTDAGNTNTMSASTEHFYLIPADKAYNVTFKVDLYQAGVKLDTYTRTATIPAADMQRGKSYDIKTTLTAQNTSDDGQLWPIEFTVDAVTGWTDPATDVTGTVNQPTTGNN